LIGGVWAYTTFFVVPIIVLEGTGPLQAIGQSTSLIRATWSRQFTANFAFGIAYFLAFIVIALPAAAAWTVSPVLAIVVAVLLGGLAFATLPALQGIFTAALYRYTKGEASPGFDQQTLAGAFTPK
jgi:cobalamin biosynthesis protein CobD/CbiB